MVVLATWLKLRNSKPEKVPFFFGRKAVTLVSETAASLRRAAHTNQGLKGLRFRVKAFRVQPVC